MVLSNNFAKNKIGINADFIIFNKKNKDYSYFLFSVSPESTMMPFKARASISSSPG